MVFWRLTNCAKNSLYDKLFNVLLRHLALGAKLTSSGKFVP
jgi:hypothetical protein